MSLTAANALVTVTVGSGTPTPLANGGSIGVLPGSVVTFALQSTNLVQRWDLTIQSDDRTLDGKQLSWSAGQANTIALTVPLASFSIRFTSTVSDGASGIGVATGRVMGQTSADAYRASHFAKGDGVTDDTAALQAWLDVDTTSVGNVTRYLDPTSHTVTAGDGDVKTMYKITHPLFVNDGGAGHTGNKTTRIKGGGRHRVGLTSLNTYTGPAFIVGDMSVGYLQLVDGQVYNGKTMSCFVAGPGNTGGQAPVWNLSHYDMGGQINGRSAFCFEIFWNPLGDDMSHGNSKMIAEAYGTFAGNPSPPNYGTFAIWRTTIPQGGTQLRARLTTNAGTVEAFTLAGTERLNINALNHIVVDYDSTRASGQQLKLFINGAQPDASMTQAQTGTIASGIFDEFVVGSGGFTAWPQAGAPRLNAADTVLSGSPYTTCYLGRFRLSKASKYATMSGPVDPSTIVPDGDTLMYMSFEPNSGYRGSEVRASASNWIIGRSCVGAGRSIAGGSGTPVWLNPSCADLPYTNDVLIEDMALQTHCGVYAWAALGTVVRGLIVTGYKGVWLDGYSYGCAIDGPIDFINGGSGAGTVSGNSSPLYGQNCNIFIGKGSQQIHVGHGVNNGFGTQAWHIITSAASDVHVSAGFPNALVLGVYAFNYTNSIFVEGSSSDDQASGLAYCHCLIAGCGTFKWANGSIAAEHTTPAIFKVTTTQPPMSGDDSQIDVGCDVLSSNPIFSFLTARSPVRFSGHNTGSVSGPAPMVDTTAPGEVLYNNRQWSGRQVENMTLDADFTVPVNDSHYGYIEVTSSVSLTAKRNVKVQYHAAGKRTRVRNATTGAQTITWVGPTGTGVDIANGSFADLYDDGTNWVTQ